VRGRGLRAGRDGEHGRRAAAARISLRWVDPLVTGPTRRAANSACASQPRRHRRVHQQDATRRIEGGFLARTRYRDAARARTAVPGRPAWPRATSPTRRCRSATTVP
jgi:hypothetical protein